MAQRQSMRGLIITEVLQKGYIFGPMGVTKGERSTSNAAVSAAKDEGDTCRQDAGATPNVSALFVTPGPIIEFIGH